MKYPIISFPAMLGCAFDLDYLIKWCKIALKFEHHFNSNWTNFGSIKSCLYTRNSLQNFSEMYHTIEFHFGGERISVIWLWNGWHADIYAFASLTWLDIKSEKISFYNREYYSLIFEKDSLVLGHCTAQGVSCKILQIFQIFLAIIDV